jgi:hypothetical protein
VHIKNNTQLLYLSTYIHKNPSELKKYFKNEISYPWSSYQDYVKENRWKQSLEQNIVLSQFSTKKEYENFVKSSPAKEIEENMDEESLNC